MIFPIVVVMLFHGQIETRLLYGWFTLITLVYVSRILIARRFFQRNPSPHESPNWGWLMTLTTFFSGCLWAWAVCQFHVTDHYYYDVFMYVIVIGLAAGSVMLTVYWLPALFAYGVPALSGVILDLFLRDVPQKFSFTLLFLVFFFMTIKIAKGMNRTAYNVIRLQYENENLIRELEVEKERAQAASRAKTHFLASANHDLRQPVHALSLLVHGLKRELTTAQGKLLFLRLERSVKSLGNLLESLLDLSRLDADAVQVNPTRFPITPLATHLLAEYLPVAREKGLRFSVRPCDCAVYTDRTLLERLLRNLLTNAFSYTDHGGVLLCFRPRGNQLQIEVWDSGRGIPPEEQKRIFSEFYQIKGEVQTYSKGLGLGLSICQRIAQLLGTQIELRSKPESGSVFRFRLDRVTQATATDHQLSGTVDTAQFQGKTILLIDDDVEVLQAMSQVLRNWGMHPVGVRSLTEVRITLDENHAVPDVILCDHRLEFGQSGLEVVRTIQLRYPVPAIMITGDTAPENLHVIKESGLPLLHKPLTPENLAAALHSVFNGSELKT